MNWLNALRLRALKGCNIIQRTSMGHIKRDKSTAKNIDVSHRLPLPCICYPKDEKQCFDIRKIAVERGNQSHGKMIRSFLYTEYWPREPTVCSLWMRLDSPYLDILSNKYAYSGDRLLAFERIERTNERKIVGLCVANKVFPWMIDELEDWAHVTCFGPDKYRMYFCAHCLKSPNFFEKFHVDYIYEIEILGTAQEVAGQGVGVLLLKTALAHAQDTRHPLVQVIAVNQYTSRICEKCGMKRAWTMNYTDFVDDAGQRVFFPRRPHHTVGIYVKYFDPKKSIELPCSPPL